MRETASPAWREQGNRIAFDSWAWESKALQFFGASKLLLAQFDKETSEKNFANVPALLPTAEFLLSLALELICKAHYLKSQAGPPEEVYGHNTWERLKDGVLDDHQKALMRHAQEYVEWAGRYPTPKWTSEKHKERFDADHQIVEGVETIDGGSIPNSASRPRCAELIAMFEHIHLSLKG